MNKLLFFLSIPLGVMLSPESIILLGNIGGVNGSFFYTFLFISTLLAILYIIVAHSPAADIDLQGEVDMLNSAFGATSAMTVCLAGRVPIILIAGTGILVTAGYAFNEIFLYWFPNFGFAFLLLFIIVVINCLGQRWALRLQVGFSVCALLGLVVLVIWGVLSADPVVGSNTEQIQYSLVTGTTTLLLFLGCDLSVNSSKQNRNGLIILVVLLSFLFAFWVFFLRQFISLQVLSESTIPHLKAARSALGQSGRVLIGMVIITGTFATLNGLFIYSGITLKRFTSSRLIPGDRVKVWGERSLYIILGSVISLSLAAGLAGSEKLEVYYRGSLLLWLGFLGMHTLSISSILRHTRQVLSRLAFLLSTVFMTAVVVLTLVDKNFTLLFSFMLLVIVVAGVFSTLWLKLGRRFFDAVSI